MRIMPYTLPDDVLLHNLRLAPAARKGRKSTVRKSTVRRAQSAEHSPQSTVRRAQAAERTQATNTGYRDEKGVAAADDDEGAGPPLAGPARHFGTLPA